MSSDRTVKFLSGTVGRDRINRFVQYFTRYLIWQLQKTGGAEQKDTIERLSKLQANVGLTRKLMRVGRQIEFYRNAVKAMNLKDDVVRVTSILKSVFMSLWLAMDTLQWVHLVGLYKFESIKTINSRSLKFWLAALVVSFIGDIHKLRLNGLRVLAEQKALAASKGKDESAKKALAALTAERTKLMLATVQDGMDMVLPSSGLEYIKVESGIVGLVGAVTSVMGGYTHWNSL
ncbi:Peroxisomal membrane protein PMP27 [Chytridiales sp. JEL 0842]|nr:Peroxisomal membrane protein PMP27 [Chytridiales sp. JEL 0842]